MVAIDLSTRPQRHPLSFLWSNPRSVLLLGVIVGALIFELSKTHHPQPSNVPIYYTPGGLRSSSFGDSCRYYLAESAIPDAGLGLFAGVGVHHGDMLGILDVCIYVADTPGRTDFETHSWAQDVFFGQFEGRYPRAACEGFATLFNTQPPGVQNSKLVSMFGPTNAGLTRDQHPGAGAITQYYGVKSVATDNIRAGQELTIDYGDFEYDPEVNYQRPERSPEWLEENGMCIDNIVIAPANDPEMGRGAFATRSLKAGSVVAPVPLQTFKRRSKFARQEPEALFVNYCFQPKGTDMLLFPYGPGVNLINHSRKKKNVEIRWSTSKFHNKEWLNLPGKSFWNTVYPGGLLMEVVALRDIRKDEELFMDYGIEWEEAWKEHVAEWEPPIGAEHYVYPADMDETAPLRTMEEQKTQPYAKNLATVCNTPDWDRRTSNVATWEQPDWVFPEGFVYCHVLKREKGAHGDYVYEVSLNFDADTFDPEVPEHERYIDRQVPRRAIRFVDRPYQSDLHLKQAFRHPIVFPDHLVPESWKQGF